MKCHSDSYARSPDLLGWGFRHVWGSTCRTEPCKARENGSMAAIREAQQTFDYYCDKLPRTSSPETK